MKRIEKLTKKQEKLMLEYREECRKFGVSCEPADFDRAKDAITFIYKKMGYKKPEFRFEPSPYSAILSINKELGNEKPEFINSWLWGQMGYYWIAFYRFAELHLGIEYEKDDSLLLGRWEDIAQSSGWWWPYDEVCWISDRPESISLNEQFQLHNQEGPALKYRDGYSLYLSNGVRMPEEFIIKPIEDWTAKMVLGEKNVDVRREAMRKIGMPKFCELAKAKKVSGPEIVDQPVMVATVNGKEVVFPVHGPGVIGLPDELMDNLKKETKLFSYDIIDLDLDGNGAMGRYLRFENASMDGVQHVEGIPNEIDTVKEALKWRHDGIEGFPNILT